MAFSIRPFNPPRLRPCTSLQIPLSLATIHPKISAPAIARRSISKLQSLFPSEYFLPTRSGRTDTLPVRPAQNQSGDNQLHMPRELFPQPAPGGCAGALQSPDSHTSPRPRTLPLESATAQPFPPCPRAKSCEFRRIREVRPHQPPHPRSTDRRTDFQKPSKYKRSYRGPPPH